MKTLILAVLISIAFPAHAGEIIFLDNYRLEKSENETSKWGPERERERERDRGRERKEADTNIQNEANERRNIEDYTIKKMKDKRETDDTNEDSPLLEYQF